VIPELLYRLADEDLQERNGNIVDCQYADEYLYRNDEALLDAENSLQEDQNSELCKIDNGSI